MVCNAAAVSLVDGNWTVWMEWSTCSVTCENGTQIRTRNCSNPEPQYGGDNCTDMHITDEVKPCTIDTMCASKCSTS